MVLQDLGVPHEEPPTLGSLGHSQVLWEGPESPGEVESSDLSSPPWLCRSRGTSRALLTEREFGNGSCWGKFFPPRCGQEAPPGCQQRCRAGSG